MRYLIIGGTGTVGSRVVNRLVARGNQVKVLTRFRSKIKALPSDAEGVVGDLEDPNTYDRIFSGVNKLFLLTPNVLTETHLGLAAVREAQKKNITHVVHVSHDQRKGRHIPHIASKLTIEDALKTWSGLHYTILRPTNFYQNDLIFKKSIMDEKIYPQPIGNVGVSRVDARDVADAAVNAFEEPGHKNNTYAVVGPEPLTGRDCAAVYSDILSSDIRYGGNDVSNFSRYSSRSFSDCLLYNLYSMFSMYQESGLKATDEQLRQTKDILDGDPRIYIEFVNDFVFG